MKRLTSGILGVLLLGAIAAHAASGFTDEFVPANWSLVPDHGTVSLNESVLNFDGPTGSGSGSTDAAYYYGLPDLNGQRQGLTTAGTLTFSWSFNSGAALNAAAAFGSTSSSPVVLASGGPGAITTGSFTIALQQGDTFGFTLTTGNSYANKLKANFQVTQFNFVPVPEPSTVITGVLLLAFSGLRAWRRR